MMGQGNGAVASGDVTPLERCETTIGFLLGLEPVLQTIHSEEALNLFDLDQLSSERVSIISPLSIV